MERVIRPIASSSPREDDFPPSERTLQNKAILPGFLATETSREKPEPYPSSGTNPFLKVFSVIVLGSINWRR